MEELRLSDQLLDIAGDAHRVAIPGASFEQNAIESQNIANLVEYLLASKQEISQQDWSAHGATIDRLLSTLGTDLAAQFDWALSISFLKRVPKVVDRAMKLSELVGQREPSALVAGSLREATRCYIFGFWAATVALSRAAIEQALRERIYEKYAASPATLGRLIDFCEQNGVLDGARYGMANKVKAGGDKALHGGVVSAEDARDVIDAARGVLEHLHA